MHQTTVLVLHTASTHRAHLGVYVVATRGPHTYKWQYNVYNVRIVDYGAHRVTNVATLVMGSIASLM